MIDQLPNKLPFYYNSHSQKGNGAYNEVLPIDLFYDDELNMYRQKSNVELDAILEEVYQEGSLRDGSISNESGQVYVKQITDYVANEITSRQSKRVLEVGCGEGVILRELRKIVPSEIALVGIEPSKLIRDVVIDGVTLFHDFFPSAKLKGKFDLISSLLVLEHVPDPILFVNKMKEALHENGTLIIGVPNCEPFLENGDISIFIHEHFSYFTLESLQKIASLAGLKISKSEIVQGMLMATMEIQADKLALPVMHSVSTEHFLQTMYTFNTKLKDVLGKYEPHDIAIYVPGRGINTLFQLNYSNCRLVDDNSELHGRYLPYLKNPIENFADICATPPKCILIYTRTFGDIIKKKCAASKSLQGAVVLDLKDVIATES